MTRAIKNPNAFTHWGISKSIQTRKSYSFHPNFSLNCGFCLRAIFATSLKSLNQSAKSSKITENANIKSTIKEIDTLLKDEMDKLIVNFKKNNPDFVSDYHNARVIIDPGSNGGNKKPTTDNKPK
jgi:hypothetical protein